MRLAPCATLITFVLLALLASTHANGAVLSFSANVDGKESSVTAAVVQKENGNYLSLSSICTQLGAACVLQPTRVQVDFQGKSCWVRINDREANASLATFSLGQPILRQGEEALISSEDLIPFFDKAFRVTLSRSSMDGTLENPESIVPDEETPLSDIDVPSSGVLFGTVVLDPGHGGSDAGVAGQSLKEKDLTLLFAETLRKELESTLQARVILTRSEDKPLTFDERIEAINRSEGALVISIHAGASFSPNASGFEVFHSTAAGVLRTDAQGVVDSRAAGLRRAARSKAIAETVFASMQAATESQARGVHESPLRILNTVAIPGFLVELGCLTNAGEEGLLQTAAYREKLAKAIATGLADYTEKAKSRGPVQ